MKTILTPAPFRQIRERLMVAAGITIAVAGISTLHDHLEASVMNLLSTDTSSLQTAQLQRFHQSNLLENFTTNSTSLVCQTPLR
ncbi:MAG: hypothetical protein ACFBSC_01540 [Microcoleaceae cyanobacterium]